MHVGVYVYKHKVGVDFASLVFAVVVVFDFSFNVKAKNSRKSKL